MQAFEYKVVSAPRRGAKVRGMRAPEARFAAAVEAEVNRLAAEGWEYLRSDTLPCEERKGWFSGLATVSRTVLVFRRATQSALDPMALGVPAAPVLPRVAAAPVQAPLPRVAAAAPVAPPPPFQAEPPVSALPVAEPLPAPTRPAAPPPVSERAHDPLPPMRIRPEPPPLPARAAMPPGLGATSSASFAAPRRLDPAAPASPSAAATRSALEDLLSRREPGRLPPRPPAPRPEGGDPA